MFKKTLFTVLLASGFAMSGAQAADGTINFTGKILAATCTVNTGSANQDVDLGVWGADGFGAAGTTQGSIPFSISLGSCDTSLTSTSATFGGTANSDNANLLEVTTTGGTAATGLGIALYEADGTTPINLGSASTDIPTNGNATSVMNFVAKYMSTKAAAQVTPGDADAVADFTVNYK